MATWGSLTLKVETYAPAIAPVNLSEIPLVPDPDAPATTPQSVIMGTGRQRKKIRLEGYVTSVADWQSFVADCYNHIARTLTTDDDEALPARILSLSGEYKLAITDKVWFSAEFIEAE